MNNNLPAIVYKQLSEIIEKQEIDHFLYLANEALNHAHIQAIVNAFHKNTVIASNGVPYIKVQGLASILRTGASGAHRSLVYQGIPNVAGAPPVIEIEAHEYISGPELIKLIESRILTVKVKTKIYLGFAIDIYHKIIENSRVRDIRDLFREELTEKRPLLKKMRIDQYNISVCELSNTPFNYLNEVEFSHIESVVVNPFRALDIDNGLIVLVDIHKKITKENIHDAGGLYTFCERNSLNTTWIDRIA